MIESHNTLIESHKTFIESQTTLKESNNTVRISKYKIISWSWYEIGIERIEFDKITFNNMVSKSEEHNRNG